MASRGGARDGRAACATRGGGGATWKGESAAVELTGAANRGRGGGLPREGEKRRLPVGEGDPEVPRMLIGASNCGLG
jgi:hypothetical protein